MSDTAIMDVSDTLITLLRENMDDLVQDPEQDIVLMSPAELQRQTVRLSLFLYSLVENPYLKNDERRMINPTTTRRAPLSLDLYYLLTSYAQEPVNSDSTLEAHHVLGRAQQVLYDNGVLSGSVLRGSLGTRNSELRVTLNPITVEDLTRIWSVFPSNAYKTSASYLVTPAPIESQTRTTSQRVVSKQGNLDHLVPNQS